MPTEEKKEFDFDFLKKIFDILVAYIKEIIAYWFPAEDAE